jgi:hypothetical protein
VDGIRKQEKLSGYALRASALVTMPGKTIKKDAIDSASLAHGFAILCAKAARLLRSLLRRYCCFRRLVMRSRLLLLATLFALVVSNTCLPQEQPAETTHDKIYFFEHRLIPQWVHDTNGAFFSDLVNGEHAQLLAFASQVVSSEFSEGISIITYPEKASFLIRFPEPGEPPECFFIYVQKNEDSETFSLYTYEKTLELGEGGFKGVVGSWSADKSHANQGPRSYDDAASFISDVEE